MSAFDGSSLKRFIIHLLGDLSIRIVIRDTPVLMRFCGVFWAIGATDSGVKDEALPMAMYLDIPTVLSHAPVKIVTGGLVCCF